MDTNDDEFKSGCQKRIEKLTAENDQLKAQLANVTADTENLKLCLREIYHLTQDPDDDYQTIFLNIESLANSQSPGYMDFEAYNSIEMESEEKERENRRLTAERDALRALLGNMLDSWHCRMPTLDHIGYAPCGCQICERARATLANGDGREVMK